MNKEFDNFFPQAEINKRKYATDLIFQKVNVNCWAHSRKRVQKSRSPFEKLKHHYLNEEEEEKKLPTNLD